MALFRTKTLSVEAQQWSPGMPHEMVCYVCPDPPEAHVHTENGVLPLNEGDWLVRDTQGSPWLITATVFAFLFTPEGGQPC